MYLGKGSSRPDPRSKLVQLRQVAQALLSWVLYICKDGDFTASLGNLLWCLITLTIVGGGTKNKPATMTKKPLHIFLVRNFLCSNLSPFSLVLFLCISERSRTLSPLCLSIQLLECSKIFPLHSLLKLNKLSSQPHLIMCSGPLAILVTP